MESLSILTRQYPQTNAFILTCAGKITLGENCQIFIEEMERLLVSHTRPKIILDLSLVNGIDSSGLQRIAKYCGIFRNNGGDIKITGASEKIFQ